MRSPPKSAYAQGYGGTRKKGAGSGGTDARVQNGNSHAANRTGLTNKAILANGKRGSFSKALVRRFYALYRRGSTVPQVAEKFGLRQTQLYGLFRREKLKLRVWRGGSPKRVKIELIQRMHANYQVMSLATVGRKYGRCGTQIRDLFVSRGFSVRPWKAVPFNPKNGRILPVVPKTRKQLAAIISRMNRVNVPAELKQEWRHWSLKRRGDFIRQVRRRLGKSRNDAPATELSPNVEPFDYASARARAIMRKANEGLPSRLWKVRIFTCSQGVIYDNQLWFWVPDTGYCRGVWKPEDKRPQLHHVIWAKHHGRKVPSCGVIRFIDRNPNNFSPNNLTLLTRNDICRENQAKALMEKSREQAALLLERSQRKEKHGLIEELQRAA